jgi:putative YphP/YqiW family bacilliredoxin
MYPEHLTAPMAKELTDYGFRGLLNGAEVREALDSKEGSALIIVNSVKRILGGNK